jgi:hypothetical protein
MLLLPLLIALAVRARYDGVAKMAASLNQVSRPPWRSALCSSLWCNYRR